MQGWRAHALSTASNPPASKAKALLIANSTLFGGTYFGHCGDVITAFLKRSNVKSVLFVPWALHDYDKYFGNPGGISYDERGQPLDHTGRPKARLAELGFECTSIHHAEDPVREIGRAKLSDSGIAVRIVFSLHLPLSIIIPNSISGPVRQISAPHLDDKQLTSATYSHRHFASPNPPGGSHP